MENINLFNFSDDKRRCHLHHHSGSIRIQLSEILELYFHFSNIFINVECFLYK